jgi:hypothetical protein
MVEGGGGQPGGGHGLKDKPGAAKWPPRGWPAEGLSGRLPVANQPGWVIPPTSSASVIKALFFLKETSVTGRSVIRNCFIYEIRCG